MHHGDIEICITSAKPSRRSTYKCPTSQDASISLPLDGTARTEYHLPPLPRAHHRATSPQLSSLGQVALHTDDVWSSPAPSHQGLNKAATLCQSRWNDEGLTSLTIARVESSENSRLKEYPDTVSRPMPRLSPACRDIPTGWESHAYERDG